MKTKISNQDITLLRELDSTTSELREDAQEALLKRGDSVDPLISSEFPGQVNFNPLESPTSRPPLEESSGLLNYICKRGFSAQGLVLPHLLSDDPLARFFAVYYFFTFPESKYLPELARRLYDSEPAIRELTVEAIRKCRDSKPYESLLKSLLTQLRVPQLQVKLGVVQILGLLKEPSTVPALIDLTNSTTPSLRAAAASSLTTICVQDFGDSRNNWGQWWKLNRAAPRESWLVKSLRHPNPTLSKISFSELKHLAPQSTPLKHFSGRLPESTIKELENWWKTESTQPQPETCHQPTS